MSSNNSSILKTLAYSDIFDYPLTKEEIWKFLIGKKISRASFEKELKGLVASEATPLGCNRNFHYLSGRRKIVSARIKKLKDSKKKIISAKKIIRYLSFIPTVLLIGISGGLALENADEKDDIDLFIISSKGKVWLTRLLLIFLLILLGEYRGRGKKQSHKVCLNMLIDEKALMFEKDRQDLYTAHEIVQLKPIFDRNNIYQEFINVNKWVSKFLPNAMDRSKSYESRIMKRRSSLLILEKLAKLFQLWYMKKHKTKETVGDHFLAFHPFNHREYILKEYNKRLRKYDLPSPRLRRVMPPKLG